MQRIFILVSVISLVILVALSNSYAASWFNFTQTTEDDSMSAAHRIITSQEQWLNTSRALTPEDLKGRIILLDFWTYCCINCMHVIPELQELEATFGDDLTVIGVHSAKFKNEKETSNIRQAILRYEIEHPVVNDFDFSIWQQFGVRAWPTLVLINPDGKIESVYSGEGNKATIEADIKTLQKKYAGKYTSGGLPIALEADKTPQAVLAFPAKLTWGEADNQPLLFISDTNNHRIIGVNPESGEIELEIGSGHKGASDGSFEDAAFNAPQGITYHAQKIYVADTLNHTIREIDLKTRRVRTIAGTGSQGYNRTARNDNALSTAMASPWDVTIYPEGSNTLAIAMAGTHQLWSLNLDEEKVSVLAGNGRESIDDGRYPLNSLSQPSGLSVHNGKLYFVDSETSSLRALENGVITTLIGTGLFDFGYKEGNRNQALMQHAIGVYADDTGVYIADTYNHAIRRYDVNTHTLYNYAGTTHEGHQNGSLATAEFFEPNDVLRINNTLYVADTNNHLIRTIKDGKVSSLQVTPKASALSSNEWADILPNSKQFGAMEVSSAPKLQIALPDDWKINEDAPSYLALFSSENQAHTNIANYALEDIKDKQIEISALDASKEYTLQGTLYYCKKDNSGSCLIISPQLTLKPKADGQKMIQLSLPVE